MRLIKLLVLFMLTMMCLQDLGLILKQEGKINRERLLKRFVYGTDQQFALKSIEQ